MKHIDYVTETTSQSTPKDAKGTQSNSRGDGPDDIGRGKGVNRAGIKGSSITLHGSGDRSGRDAFNSMSLSEAYRDVVLVKRQGEG